METRRIPDFANKSFHGMAIWFNEMSRRDLLFHPDDAASTIITIATDEKMFTEPECEKLDGILRDMFERFGDRVHEAAYPVFMRRMGIRVWRDG